MDRSLSLPSGHAERNKNSAVLRDKYGVRWLEPTKGNTVNSQDMASSDFTQSTSVDERQVEENAHKRLASVYTKRPWPPKPVYKSFKSMDENTVTKEKAHQSGDGGLSFPADHRNEESGRGKRAGDERFFDHFQEPSGYHTTVITKNLRAIPYSSRVSKDKAAAHVPESTPTDTGSNFSPHYNNFDRPKPYVKPKTFGKSVKNGLQHDDHRPQSENSFFDMVKDYRFELRKNVDQRSPASRTMTKVLGPGLDAALAMAIPTTAVTDKSVTSDSLPKAIQNSSQNHEGQCAALKCYSLEKDRPRQSFAHYDWQSMTFSFSDVLLATETLKRKNEMTGASKAAALTARMHSNDNSPAASCENLHDFKVPEKPGNSVTNDVLGWCPFFCNEIGGVSENEMFSFDSKNPSSSAQSPAVSVQLLLPENGNHSVTNSPTHAQMLLGNPKGVSVMEKIGIDDDKQLNAVGFIQEYVDGGALYYRNHFHQQDHQNFFGIDEKYGPVAISIKREKLKETNVNVKENVWHFRVIVRASELCTLRGAVLEDVIISQHHSAARALRMKDVLDYVCPEITFDCLKSAPNTEAVQKQLLKVDEQNVAHSYKIGIMYCRKGQTTEEEMYNNEHGSPALEEFLDLLGDRVLLKGFDKFRGGLDVKTNSTGKESYFTTFQGIEIMFHVSTLLPYTGNNVQQLLRKRHIGNDIVTIVFQEPDSPAFSPQNIRSHFQHLFVVVRVHQPCSNRTSYRIAVTRSQDIPSFGPVIPKDALFPKSETFREFLLMKLLNGERVARSAGKFKAMSMNTRQEYLRDLALHHCSPNGLDASQKFTRFSLSAASRRVKDRDKSKNRVSTGELSPGALMWHVLLHDCGPEAIACMLGISDYMFCLIKKSTNRVVFSIPCQAIIGWADFSSETLHLYYGRGERIAISARSCSSCDWMREVKLRLLTFSIGCETKTKTLRRNAKGQLGFHINYEGIVMDVEINGYANHVGLTQGCRLVEICKVLVVTMTHEEMLDLLRTSDVVTVIMIPPLEDGTPRRCSKSLYHVSPVLKMIDLHSSAKNPSPAPSGDDAVVHSRSRSDPAYKSAKQNKSLEDITQVLAQSLNLRMNSQGGREKSQGSSARTSAASTPTAKMNPLLGKRPLNQSSSIDPSLVSHHTRPLLYQSRSTLDTGKSPYSSRRSHFTTIPLKKNKDKSFMGSSKMKHSTSTESGLNLTSYDYDNTNSLAADGYSRFTNSHNFKTPFQSTSASSTTAKMNPSSSKHLTKPQTNRSSRQQPYNSSPHEAVFMEYADAGQFSSTAALRKEREKFFPHRSNMKHSTSTESGLNLNANTNNNGNYAPQVSHPHPARRKKVSYAKVTRSGDMKNELRQLLELKHKNQHQRQYKAAATPPTERRKPINHFNGHQLTRAMSDESICGIVNNTSWRKDKEESRERSRDNLYSPLPLPNLVDSWEQIVHAAKTAEEQSTVPGPMQSENEYFPSGPSDYSTDEDTMLTGVERGPRSAASISPILPRDNGSSEEGGYEPLSHISTQSDADLRLRKIEDALKSLQTQLALEQRSKKKILREVERLRKDNLRLQEKANLQHNNDPSEN